MGPPHTTPSGSEPPNKTKTYSVSEQNEHAHAAARTSRQKVKGGDKTKEVQWAGSRKCERSHSNKTVSLGKKGGEERSGEGQEVGWKGKLPAGAHKQLKQQCRSIETPKRSDF